MIATNDYLVNYGRAAFLGRFVNRAGESFARGDRVVLQSERGIESGDVLGMCSPTFGHLVGYPTGDILRRFTKDDDTLEQNHLRLSTNLVNEAQREADALGLPLTVLDGEILLGRDQAIIHLLPFGDCDPSPLRELLSRRNGIPVSFLDPRAIPEPESKGCGKPGCGSSGGGCSDCGSGGGCSTGGCASGKIKDANEMTAYFAQMRQKMDRDRSRVSLHE